LSAKSGEILHQAYGVEKKSLEPNRASRIGQDGTFLPIDGLGYTSREMYARKFVAEMTIGAERRPVPLDWLDSFCMRNFTGSAEFDDTLPTREGRLEVGLGVDAVRLARAMSEWFTKRGKGGGAAVTVELREET
jgi:hypothetical protein